MPPEKPRQHARATRNQTHTFSRSLVRVRHVSLRSFVHSCVLSFARRDFDSVIAVFRGRIFFLLLGGRLSLDWVVLPFGALLDGFIVVRGPIYVRISDRV